MPRQARLDAPHVLHHVMARGIERSGIFRDDHDGEESVKRLSTLATSGGLMVYGWSLLPNIFTFWCGQARFPFPGICGL